MKLIKLSFNQLWTLPALSEQTQPLHILSRTDHKQTDEQFTEASLWSVQTKFHLRPASRQ